MWCVYGRYEYAPAASINFTLGGKVFHVGEDIETYGTPVSGGSHYVAAVATTSLHAKGKRTALLRKAPTLWRQLNNRLT